MKVNKHYEDSIQRLIHCGLGEKDHGLGFDKSVLIRELDEFQMDNLDPLILEEEDFDEFFEMIRKYNPKNEYLWVETKRKKEDYLSGNRKEIPDLRDFYYRFSGGLTTYKSETRSKKREQYWEEIMEWRTQKLSIIEKGWGTAKQLKELLESARSYSNLWDSMSKTISNRRETYGNS